MRLTALLVIRSSVFGVSILMQKSPQQEKAVQDRKRREGLSSGRELIVVTSFSFGTSATEGSVCSARKLNDCNKEQPLAILGQMDDLGSATSFERFVN